MALGREPQGEDERTEALIPSKIVRVMSAAQDIIDELGLVGGGENGCLSRATPNSLGNKYGRETRITISQSNSLPV
jgi:hypothetical protein